MKGLSKLAMKLAALLLPFPLAVAIGMSMFPKDLFDSEYGWYRQHQEYAEGHDEPCRVLIIGDSAAKVACRPELLSEDTYNFSLQGATPIEEYYSLREYLENHKAPAYLVCMNGPWYFVTDEYFWSRQVYFHVLGSDEMRDIEERLRQTGDFSPFNVASLREFRKEAALYRFYAPQKYSVVFLKNLVLNLTGNSSRGAYEANYEYAAANRGQSRYYDRQGNDLPALYVDKDSFSPSELIDHYFRALIGLCLENDIQFIFQSPPQNMSSKDSISSGWIDGFVEYMDGIQSDYPEIRVDAGVEWYDSEYFSDAFHLDQTGTERYCAALREKYPYVFDDEEAPS